MYIREIADPYKRSLHKELTTKQAIIILGEKTHNNNSTLANPTTSEYNKQLRLAS